MITILKTGYWKIMELFYKDKAARLHLREIARKTKMHGPGVTRVLNSLERGGILKSEKDGNLKKYSIKQNKETYLIFTHFDIGQLNSLPSIRRNAISYYLEALPEKPVIAFLFGSTAKGTYNEDSDIDILLITNNKIDAKGAEKHAESLTGIRTGTFQITISDFARELKLKEDHVIQAAITSGYPITNHISFYEAVYNVPNSSSDSAI